MSSRYERWDADRETGFAPSFRGNAGCKGGHPFHRSCVPYTIGVVGKIVPLNVS